MNRVRPQTQEERPVALITGGSAGLGFHVSAKFLAADYRVIVVGRDAERLQAAIDRLSTSTDDRVAAEVCDLIDPQQVADLAFVGTTLDKPHRKRATRRQG